MSPALLLMVNVPVVGFVAGVNAVGEKRTLIVQLFPPKRLLPHVPPSLLKYAGKARLMPENVGLPAGFVRLIVWVALSVPLAIGDACVPKVSEVGATATGFTPLPVSATLTVVACAFCVKLTARFSFLLPVVVGSNTTPMVQLAPAARFFGYTVPQSFTPVTRLYCVPFVPVNAIFVIASVGRPAALDTVTVRVAVGPADNNWLPNANEVGDTAAKPVPLRLAMFSVIDWPGFSCVIVRNPAFAPVDVGWKCTATVQLACGAKDVVQEPVVPKANWFEVTPKPENGKVSVLLGFVTVTT